MTTRQITITVTISWATNDNNTRTEQLPTIAKRIARQ